MVVHRSDLPTVEASPLDWNEALSAAAARLDEGWAHPDRDSHAAASLEGELAALLCAFGALGAEVNRMRELKLASGDLPSGKHRRAGRSPVSLRR